MMAIELEHLLYLRLLDQAHAVATYLIEHDLAPRPYANHFNGADDRDALERAADHVAILAGYTGTDATCVSDTLWRGLRFMLRVPARQRLSLVE